MKTNLHSRMRMSELTFVHTLLAICLIIAVFVRTFNLSWGLPYPFHPDERNMADGITRLSCDMKHGETLADTVIVTAQNCLNPEFFAYGQAPLYIGVAGIHVARFVTTIPEIFTGVQDASQLSSSVTFSEAVMSLRIQSVVYSLGTMWILTTLLVQFGRSIGIRGRMEEHIVMLFGILAFSLQQYMIQFAHFGTTESLLMFLYGAIVWLTLQLKEKLSMRKWTFVWLLVGLAAGVKVSAGVFAAVPFIILFRRSPLMLYAGMWGALGYVLAAPQNIIHLTEFLSSMNYEIGVGNGSIRVFYTRQFEDTIPYMYQLVRVFPYALGPVQLAFFVAAFLFLPWKNVWVNSVRLALVAYFIPAGGAYTKWARFVAPMMPLMSLIASMGMIYAVLKLRRFTVWIVVAVLATCSFVYGLSYVSVYAYRDVRYDASDWMLQNLDEDDHVIIESGNVVNLPIVDPHVPPQEFVGQAPPRVTVIDMYNLDASPDIQAQLDTALSDATHVVIASRRVFANHTCAWLHNERGQLGDPVADPFSGKYPGWCDKKQAIYPLVNAFYDSLQTAQIVHTFRSPPRIVLWDAFSLHFEDEMAEEAWTVFDHPTVRVYEVNRK